MSEFFTAGLRIRSRRVGSGTLEVFAHLRDVLDVETDLEVGPILPSRPRVRLGVV
jgi:hypothetical protein